MMQARNAVVVLCCTCFVGVQSICNSLGPGPCYFWRPCDWTQSSGWTVYYDCHYSYYCLGLNSTHNTTERVESRTACSTKNAVHCLEFGYYLEESDDIELSVLIKSPGMWQKEVWTMSGSTSSTFWEHARVPVNTTTEFNVIFKARSSDNNRVFIDDVVYNKKWCDIEPQGATPPPVTTSPTSQPTSTTSVVQTTIFTASITSPTTGHQEQTSQSTKSGSAPTTVSQADSASTTVSQAGSAPTTVSQADSASTTVSQAGTAAPAESSSDVGLIFGVVVAVVFLIVIAVVLCILLTRKQSHDWKTCFRANKGKEEDFHVSASHNAAYSLDDNEPHQFISVDINPVSPERDLQQQGHHRTPLASPPAENCYTVIKSPAEGSDFKPPTVEYTEAKKTKKVSNTAQGHHNSGDSPYEIGDSTEVTAPHPSSPDGSYNQLNFHTRDVGDHPDTFLPSPEQTNDYNHLASHHRETQSSTDRDEELGLYQNIVISSRARDQQQTTALYQNVPNTPATKGHQHRPGPTHVPEQDPDLAMEEQSPGIYHLPKETTQNPKPFPNPEGHEFSKSQDPTNGIYHVLEDQTPSEVDPENSHASSNATAGQYQRLDFEGKGFAEERNDDVSVPTYSHLNEGAEGAYHGIDRDRRREIIDGDYSHI